MKSQTELSNLLFLLLEVIIIVVALIAIYKIAGTYWQPHRAIAFANAERLRMAIDSACAGNKINNFDFNFPQPEPIQFGGWTSLQNIFPKFFIKTYGDPYYVLYYEMFPPGEAVAWEFNADLKKRAIIPFQSTMTSQIPSSEIDSLEARMRLNPNIADSDIIFPNIVIKDESIGKWSDDGNSYMFSNYMFLPIFNKTAIKYMSCGKDSLCLKTKEGVYRLPLPHCAQAGISMIQMQFKHDESLNPLAESSGYGQQWDYSDFNIVSPCKISMTISPDTCSCHEDAVFKTSSKSNEAIYPLYEYDSSNTLKNSNKNHISCLHRIGDATNENVQSHSCVKILFHITDSHLCSGSNANIASPLNIFSSYNPVTASTEYIKLYETPVVILKSSKDVIDSLNIKGGGFVFADYRWAWP